MERVFHRDELSRAVSELRQAGRGRLLEATDFAKVVGSLDEGAAEPAFSDALDRLFENVPLAPDPKKKRASVAEIRQRASRVPVEVVTDRSLRAWLDGLEKELGAGRESWTLAELVRRFHEATFATVKSTFAEES